MYCTHSYGLTDSYKLVNINGDAAFLLVYASASEKATVKVFP